MRLAAFALVFLASPWLVGCDQLGIESATVVAAKREAEGKAIGAGCRHSARSVEDCYSQNKRSDKSSIFAGWKEMNEYMVENKIAAVPAEAEPAATEVASAERVEPEASAGAKKGSKGEPKKQ